MVSALARTRISTTRWAWAALRCMVGRDDVSSEGRRYSLPELVGDVQRDAEMLRAVSPLEQAARIRAPVLLAFG